MLDNDLVTKSVAFGTDKYINFDSYHLLIGCGITPTLISRLMIDSKVSSRLRASSFVGVSRLGHMRVKTP